jgi:hypothetical protein
MANVTINGSAQGNAFQSILMFSDIQPGDEPSYQLCKLMYVYHPMGAKMVEAPVTIAMSKKRKISVPSSPGSLAVDAFEREWKALGCDKLIANVMHLKRIYGVASVAYGAKGVPTEHAIPLNELSQHDLYFNTFDPLNSAGSLVLNQDPNAPDFQKPYTIRVQGSVYHRSRVCIVMNESPIYIQYTSSSFGFVGRSVYQRALFPMKSYIQSMITNDLVITKAGVIIAKIKQAGAIIDDLIAKATGRKRDILKEANQGNVISISPDEDIETLNLNNTDTAIGMARTNIIEDIASSANMPPKLLLANGYASVLANGTEDFKGTMQYIDAIREDMQPLYDFFDAVVMHRAWSPEFYATIQAQFPEAYMDVGYTQAFYRWKNDFAAEWPSLQEEPEKDKAQGEKVKLDAIIAVIEKFAEHLDPANKAKLIEWAADNLNENKTMFTNPLDLDIDELLAFLNEQKDKGDQNGVMGQGPGAPGDGSAIPQEGE